MNNKQLYLAWLRTEAPAVYISAVRRATGQIQSLGGLTDDLVQQAFAPRVAHSFLGDDTSSMDTTFMSYGQPDLPIDNSFTPTSIDFQTPSFDSGSVVGDYSAPLTFQSGMPSGGLSVSPAVAAPSTFTNILSAVAAIGAGVLTASNNSKLISLNTTRAAQGLPPINAAGQVVTGAGTTATGSALLAFERSISGASGSMMLPILAILGIGAFFVFSRGSSN